MGMMARMNTEFDIPTPPGTEAKMGALIETLRAYRSIAIGFSGGVDSTFLAAVSIRALPPGDVHLIHLNTPLVGSPERASFERERARFEDVGAHVIEIETDPLADPVVAANPTDRCYHCKRLGFGLIMETARTIGVGAVLEGSNADDVGDHRPGTRAIRELGARSPLMETGWRKDEEREALRLWGHEVWNLPAGACLATRIPCGEAITADKLRTVRACEEHLHDLGFSQVRVRLARGAARVSVDKGELESPLLGHRVDGGRSLPRGIIAELERRGASKVDPIVREYIHGEGNGKS